MRHNDLCTLEYYQKCRSLAQSIGDNYHTDLAEAQIAHIMGKRGSSCESGLEAHRARYKKHPNNMSLGKILLTALIRAGHAIEGERLLANLLKVSTQIHGPDHGDTAAVKVLLPEVMVRRVALPLRGGGRATCQVVRYIGEDCKKCIVRGPIKTPRIMGEERVIEAKERDLMFMGHGTPVICHGLKKAQRLNGKIGDVRSYDPYVL